MELYVCSYFPNISTSHEKNVPALSKASCPPIRFPGPHGHQERPRDHRPPSGQGPGASGRGPDRAQVHASYAGLSPAVRGAARLSLVSFLAQALPDSSRSEALPRARIIRRRTIFDATRLQGRRVSNRFMSLNFLPRAAANPGETGSVAFLTPKRLGPATVRNRLRRRMREIYRRDLAQVDEPSYLVWVARPPALELPFEELKKCMAALRERMKIS